MSITVTFISNALTPHQVPFSEAMYKLIGENYKFVSCFPLSKERIEMGWKVHDGVSYELNIYESTQALEQAEKLLNNSDVVLIGSAPDSYVKQRLKNKKLTFKYSERIYKKGLNISTLPRAILSSYIHHGKFQNAPLYMLCASAYTAGDLAIFGNYKNKAYRWGYFPQLKEYNIEQLLNRKRGSILNILWTGRFIDCKHPENALDVARNLEKENIDFHLKMIGSGVEFERIKNMSDNLGLNNRVELLGAMKPEEVRTHMEEANIFLFTSDFNEGWGAVLNEAMNSGCAVVASHAIGSVPFLLKHGENGLVYQNGDMKDLCEKVISLAKEIRLCENFGRNAYLTIKNAWNAEVAAERFVNLSKKLLLGKMCEYEDGVCSKADLVKNNWFNR